MPTTIPKPTCYEQDYYAWLTESAELIREGRIDAIDTAQLVEELEYMGRSERRAIESYLKVLFVLLLKWRRQPERRGTSWELSIANARDAIARRLQESPSLRLKLPEMIVARYPNARRRRR